MTRLLLLACLLLACLLLACLLLTGCQPACFQFETNRNCPVIDFELAQN